MINKTVFAVVAALVAVSASVAHANEKLDPATGLRTEFYYAPFHELARQGAPMSSRAQVYLRENPAARARSGSYNFDTRASGGNRFTNGFNARAQVPGPRYQSEFGAWPDSRCVPEFDGTGSPKGPYCFGNAID